MGVIGLHYGTNDIYFVNLKNETSRFSILKLAGYSLHFTALDSDKFRPF